MPVYIIQAGDTAMVKIGWAEEPDQRRAVLQTAHWLPLRTIRLIDGVPATERWMHRRFAAFRVANEWFRFDEAMLHVQPPVLLAVEPIISSNPDPILAEIESFLVASGITPTAFGVRALNDPTLVRELRAGRECKRATRAKILDFIRCETDKAEPARSAA